MKSLVECRNELNEIDSQIQELFIKRMDCVRNVAFYKIVHELPIYDPKREEEMIERLSKTVDKSLQPYYVKVLKELLKVSKEYQSEIVNGSK